MAGDPSHAASQVLFETLSQSSQFSRASIDDPEKGEGNSADDFKQFQELFKRVAQSQDIPLEEVQTNQHKLVQILQPSSTSKITLPINYAILEPTDRVWQTPASILSTCKKADRKYYVPAKGVDFLFSPPPPNSSVVNAANKRGKQQV
ncbi:hypothetical protein UY3_09716 [Chelonia mydas]|uniref:Uncharacterized protein n=1 Tax=Chelonia mydas TaxID=8469 RepID=M7B7P2_CHEMY|nr:hypothetical protein UY3_09716 [Chelonia mydas]